MPGRRRGGSVDPGVTAATEVVRTTVRVGLDKYPAQGVTLQGLTRTWDPDVTGGSLADFGAGSVAVSEVAAEQLGLNPGQHTETDLGDSTPVAFTVVAVYSRGLGFGDLTLAHDLVARHMDNPLASRYWSRDGQPTRLTSRRTGRGFPGVAVLAPATAIGSRPSGSRRTPRSTISPWA